MTTNPLFPTPMKRLRAWLPSIPAVLFWLLLIMMAFVFGVIGAIVLWTHQNFRVQIPVVIETRCAFCPWPTLTPKVKKPLQKGLNFKVDEDGKSILIK